jgi:hypothetical protein
LSDNEGKWEYRGTVHQLFIDFKREHESVDKELPYDIIIKIGMPMKI